MRKIALAVLAVGFGMVVPLTISHAQTTPQSGTPPNAMQGMQPMMAKMMAQHGSMMMMRDHTEGYLAFLKTEFQITDAQNASWTAFADAARSHAKKAREAMPPMGGMMAMPATPGAAPTPAPATMPGMAAMQASWPDKLAAGEKALTAQLDALKTMRPVATALYAVLTPGQKKKADELMPAPMMGMPMGM